MDCISETKIDLKKLKEYVKGQLSEKRWTHTKNVVEEAQKLCKLYGGNTEKCTIAAIFHDVAKERPKEELNSIIRSHGLDEKYIDNSNLSHGKIAAILLKEEWGICDKEILNALSYHTTGRAEMSKTEKIVFIADAIEPARDYNGVDELRKATYEDLDKGCLKSLEDTIEHLQEKKVLYIDEDTLKARDWFKQQVK